MANAVTVNHSSRAPGPVFVMCTNMTVYILHDHDTTSDDHDMTSDDHDMTSDDHDMTSDDHDMTSDDHDMTSDDHDMTFSGDHDIS